MSRLRRLLIYVRSLPLVDVPKYLASRFFVRRIPKYRVIQDLFRDKVGLEVGGPSAYFGERNILPLYPVIKSLDGVNFSTETLWEGSLQEGRTFRYGGRLGRQYICDAVRLNSIESERYDFVIACNSLEHIANPLSAVQEWLRVIKNGGLLLLVLPNQLLNFDRKRPVVTFDHLLSDFRSNTLEDDLSHLDEIVKLHDLDLDPEAGSIDDFVRRAQDNYNNRALHHHVFDMKVLRDLCKFFKLQVVAEYQDYNDFYIVGRKAEA